ncbi:uncharacterized protein EMH_0092430 [Eimeria mitis]|uniref:Uncharacterized protein n=1 Tax=Eimeria mitis TaxID=44415 RepID=U6K9U2_9EIME|nr:uncharacterized protein EMH_0092430 [Eimeria mitis]CDJ34729.1 hypothetical protein, conserved [Eimeria mitis]
MAVAIIDCLRALRPLCMALTPTQPKVLASYLSLVEVLLEDDVERGCLSGQGRLANAALESIHVLAMHAADVQLQQGHYSPNIESPEAAETLFVLTPQGDSLQQVYVHLAQLASALLQKLPNEQMTSAVGSSSIGIQ